MHRKPGFREAIRIVKSVCAYMIFLAKKSSALCRIHYVASLYCLCPSFIYWNLNNSPAAGLENPKQFFYGQAVRGDVLENMITESRNNYRAIPGR